MIRYLNSKQLSLAEFDWPFQTALDGNNRWVRMSRCIPWDELAVGYYQGLSVRQGRPAKDARRGHRGGNRGSGKGECEAQARVQAGG